MKLKASGIEDERFWSMQCLPEDTYDFYSTALETVGAIVVIANSDGRIAYVNKACEDASLRSSEEMVTRPLYEFFARDEAKIVKNYFSQVQETATSCQFKAHWVSKYGKFRLVDWLIDITNKDVGSPYHVVLTGIDITDRQRAEDIVRRDVDEMRIVLTNSVQAFSLTVEKRDPYTAGHQHRVAELAVAIAQELGLTTDRIEGIRLGGLVHDIGKIYVPAEILTRPGRLSGQEFDIVANHPRVGYDIVKDLTFPWPIREMILQHHERVDGSGYPQGLRGDAIALEARVISVADVVEAVSSHRPYRPALGMKKALEIVKDGRGGAFDEAVVDACVKLFSDGGFEWRGF